MPSNGSRRHRLLAVPFGDQRNDARNDREDRHEYPDRQDELVGLEALWSCLRSRGGRVRAHDWSSLVGAEPRAVLTGDIIRRGSEQFSQRIGDRDRECDRRRAAMSLCESAGTSSTTARKLRCPINNNTQSVSQITVAVRGPWSRSENSPTIAPAPEGRDLLAVAFDDDGSFEHHECLGARLALIDDQAAS